MRWITPTGKWIDRPLKRDELIREDGRIEKLCKDGVGHPIGHLREWKKWMGIHGCTGGCSRAEFYLDEDGKLVDWFEPKVNEIKG